MLHFLKKLKFQTGRFIDTLIVQLEDIETRASMLKKFIQVANVRSNNLKSFVFVCPKHFHRSALL